MAHIALLLIIAVFMVIGFVFWQAIRNAPLIEDIEDEDSLILTSMTNRIN